MLRKSLRWSLIYLLEAIAALLALAIFAAGALLWRLSSGPIELNFLREDAQHMLAQAFEGDVVALGALEARFDPDARALLILARDVTVADASGDVIARAPQIEAGLAVDALLFGRLEPVTIGIEGGSVSVVRRADGAVGAGLGSVARVAADARMPAGGDDSANLFELMSGPRMAAGPVGRLQRVRISDAAVRIVDEITGIAWLLDDAGVTYDRDDDRIDARVEGQFATPSGFAPVSFRVQADADLDALLFQARFDELSPAGVLPDSGPLAPFKALDAPVDLDIVVDATRESGIRTASIVLDIGRGVILSGGTPQPLAEAHLAASFDPVESVLAIHEGYIESDIFTASLDGQITELDRYRGALPMRGRFELHAGPGFMSMGDVFERDPQWEMLDTEGEIRIDENRIVFDRLDLAVDTIRGELAGEASLERRDSGRWLPNLRLSGPILGDVQPETVLAYWPVELADGARDWVRDGILGGRFFNARFDLDLRAEAIERGHMNDERMTLSFDFEDAVVRYISTMSIIEEGRGSAVLRGNSFAVDMESGRIGDIRIHDGFVDIPRLNPKGAMARYGGVATARAADILALIDEPPLHLASDYGIDPALVGGEGEMRFEIRRAMLSDVPPEDIPFFIDGRIHDASLDVPGLPVALTGGEVTISASQEGLQIDGEALYEGTPVTIGWTETFGLPDDAASTRISVAADVDARTLDAFNIPARRYLDGPLRLTASAVSDGLDIRSVDIHADLTDALLEAPAGLWSKAAGEPGAADVAVSRDDTGFALDSVRIASDGLDLSASAHMTDQGRLERIDFDRFYVEGLADIGGELRVPEETGAPLQVRVSGRYADVSGLIGDLSFPGQGGDSLALSASVDISRLILSDTSVLDDFSLIWRSEPLGVRAFSFSGNALDGPVQAFFGASEEGGAREFRLQAQSVERMASLFGIDSYARGGRVAVLGTAPPLGVDGPMSARVEVSDLTLVRVPILARILAAGSFQGLAALLNGDGIVFDRIDGDVLYEDGLLTIADARATGSALGVSAAGTIDFQEAHAAIDGNLAPSYVLNSLLGDVPVIGDILVSRPGEGVIGITYSVEGPFDSLTVFANPLSALAPGLLRRLFEGTAADRAARQRDAGGDDGDAPGPDVRQETPDAPDGTAPDEAQP